MARYEADVASGCAWAVGTPFTGAALQPNVTAVNVPLIVHVPIGANRYLVIVQISITYVSGTPAPGHVFLCASTDTGAAAPVGTAQTATNLFLGNPMGTGSLVAAYSPGNFPAGAPTAVLKYLCSIDAIAGPGIQPLTCTIDLGGEFLVYPGTSLSIQSFMAGAGMAPMFAFGVVYLERSLDELPRMQDSAQGVMRGTHGSHDQP